MFQDSLEALIQVEGGQTHVICHDVGDSRREATRSGDTLLL